MNRLILVLAMAVIVSPGQAQELTEEQRQGLNNLQHEIAICSVFYKFSEEGMRRMNTEEALEQALTAAALSNGLRVTAGILGELIGMKAEAMTARLEMAAVHMMDKMDGNFVNYSILLQEYATHCANMYSNSSTMVEEIMGK